MYGKFGRWTDVGKGFRNTWYVTGMSTMKSFALIATIGWLLRNVVAGLPGISVTVGAGSGFGIDSDAPVDGG